MIEKPDLSDDAIIQALKTDYSLPVETVEFLPLGNDSGAWSYRVNIAGGEACFLKVRRGDFPQHAATVTCYLHRLGFDQVVAPLPANDGRLWTALNDFHLLLYPFIEGQNAMQSGLSTGQWGNFGALLRKIHAVQLTAELEAIVPVESFHPHWAPMVRMLDHLVRAQAFRDPIAQALAETWRSHWTEIAGVTERAIALGARLRTNPRPLVLCHADIHTANLLVDPQGGLHVVDWDGTLLAPKERDLMFSVDEQQFYRGYGAVEIDQVALSYYQYEWAVQEIGDFGERVFLMDDLGEATRLDSLAGFRQLFDPGDVVEVAFLGDPDRA